jgi:hypothetical protein
MDPNDQQPPPNQPPQESTPGWGAPPPPAGAPGTQPGWDPAPAAPARGGIPRLLIVVGVVALLIVVGVVLAVLRSGHADAGKVVFTSHQPTATEAQTCDVGTRVTSIKVGTPVYAVYFFSRRLAATDTVNLELIKDGTSITSNPVPSNKTSDADCLEAFQDISATLDQPGTYEIKLTVGGEVVSDGTLTITP